MSKSGFFDDGNTDILLQNTTGAVAIWDMSGTSILSGGLASSDPGAAWQIQGVAGGVTITPGSGSFTDMFGNVYTITPDGVAEVNGAPAPGGASTDQMVYYNGFVYGQDAGTGAWFILFNDNSFGAADAPGFFGDGNSSIVLQNTNGSVALWDMSGTTVVTGGLVASNPGPTWQVKGTGNFQGATGDAGILLQNTDETVAVWDMSGTTIVGGGVIGDPGAGWAVKGTGDFIGDGNTDILFQNTDGSVAIWDVYGTSIIGGGAASSNPGPTWQIVGTGNFFGDGSTDIVLQNTDGSVAIWDMNGLNVVGGGLVASDPGPTWHVKGTGDYNGDGRSDIVLQNNDGSVAIWDMNGITITGGGLVNSSPGPAWNVIDNVMQFIYGSSGDETLTATPMAADEFVFTGITTGSHTIDGFNPLEDMIQLSKTQFASFADVQAATSSVSGSAMIKLGHGSLLLQGVDPASLHASNFALA
jgi:hypothetical protein